MPIVFKLMKMHKITEAFSAIPSRFDITMFKSANMNSFIMILKFTDLNLSHFYFFERNFI